MATRFCSPDSGGGESVAARPCASSSLLTGFALRTSGSAGAVELAAKALRVSGGPTAGAVVATAPMFGAAVGLDLPEATAGVAVVDVRALVLLEVRIAIHGHALGILKRVQVRRDVDIQEFPVNKQETLRVRQARELRKIVRLNFRQPVRANFGHARGFIEREISR